MSRRAISYYPDYWFERASVRLDGRAQPTCEVFVRWMTLAVLGIADRTANYVHRWEGGSSVRTVRGFLRRVPSFKRLAAPDQIRCLVRWNVDDVKPYSASFPSP